MKDKIVNYFKNAFDGLGIFINTLLGGKPKYSWFDHVAEFFRSLKERF